MTRTLLRRLLTGAITLFLVTAVVFLLVRATAGDPLTEEAAEGLRPLSPETVEQIRRAYHLDQPIHLQYGLWLADVVRGDLGRSVRDRRPVTDKIGERLAPTVVLNLAALGLMVLIAVPLGLISALRPGSYWERIVASGTYALQALPVFWIAMLAQILLAVQLDWLPLSGLQSDDYARLSLPGQIWDRLLHMVLPVLCLTYGGIAYLARFVRTNLLENFGDEGLRAARARGLGLWAILVRHGLRRAAVPLLTLAGFVLPSIFGGSVIVENVFAIPGLGQLFVDSVMQRDLPVLLGLILVSGSATVAGILLADLAYVRFDPRVHDELS